MRQHTSRIVIFQAKNPARKSENQIGQNSKVKEKTPVDIILLLTGCYPTSKRKLYILKDTARYTGLLPAPAEGSGLRPRLFLPFGQKKSLLCCFGPFLAIFGVQ